MKDFASKQHKRLFLMSFIISAMIFIPLVYTVHIFIRSTTDELVKNWFQNERTAIQQGNILSSVTKIQRAISDSVLIKAVKVIDSNEREVITFGEVGGFYAWPVLSFNEATNDLRSYNINLVTRMYSFANKNTRVFILTGSIIPLYFALGVSFYFIILFLYFGSIIKRESVALERTRNELQNQDAVLRLETSEKLANLAAQVSHDIRSPLAALNTISSTLKTESEDNRILIKSAIQRINDIANDLLNSSRQAGQANETQDDNLSTELIAPIIDMIVSEKRIQYRGQEDIEISYNLLSSYGIFGEVNKTEMSRVISNLVNNAVEAKASEKKIKIEILLNAEDEDYLSISIIDNGIGIPENILSRLGEKGFTFGKEKSGSGLGLYHAKKTVEKLFGSLSIVSQNQSTIIKMILPKSPAPKWFIKSLPIEPAKTIITVDDDATIHQIWSERFKTRNDLNTTTQLHKEFLSASKFQDQASLLLNEASLILIDYEFLNQQKTGLDIIEEIGQNYPEVFNKTVLVTSRYDEYRIIERCNKFGVKILPKSMATLVPFEVSSESVKYDAVLIDDDKLIRLSWKMAAKKYNRQILTFESFESFLSSVDNINVHTPIYVDSSLGKDHLGKDIIGESLIPTILQLGFKKIYMASGYEKSQFEGVSGLSGVIGKSPEFVFSN